MTNIKQRIIPEFISGSSTLIPPSPRCIRTRPSPSRERGKKKECVRSIHLRAQGSKNVLALNPARERGNKLSPSPVGEKVGVARMRGKGFTLIELLVVVLIIAILAAVALPQYQKSIKKARFEEWNTTVTAYMKAIDLYLLQNGGFPTSTVYATGVNPGLLLDVNIPCNTTINQSCVTTVGMWTVLCYSDECRISFRMPTSANYSTGYDIVLRRRANSWELEYISDGYDTDTRKMVYQILTQKGII